MRDELGAIALIACGEGAFLSHRTAAFVWGLRKTAPEEVELTVVGRSVGSREEMRVHRMQAVDHRDLRHHEGLWVSSPARAVLEIAAVAPEELVDVIDEGLASRRLDRREMDAALPWNRPCGGAPRLASILGDEDAMALTRSKREQAFLRLMRQSGLPIPEVNVKFGRYELDFMWRGERLVVEIDGYNYHSGPAVFHRDQEKDLLVGEPGLEMLRFTGDHVLHQPAKVLVRVAQTLARLTGD